MLCCYCPETVGVVIRIGPGRYAHRACFVEADKREEALDLEAPPTLSDVEVVTDTVACACHCGAWWRKGPPTRGPAKKYLNDDHRRRANKPRRASTDLRPRHVGEVLREALARIPGRPE